MPEKTINLPDDVLPIIDQLDMPFARWVAQQLRRHDAERRRSFSEQLLADAALAEESTARDREVIGKRMERSAEL